MTYDSLDTHMVRYQTFKYMQNMSFQRAAGWKRSIKQFTIGGITLL